MLRNFDEELMENREFQIGGEVFEFVYPHWELGAKIFDDDLEPAKNGDGPDEGTHFFQADTKLAIERLQTIFISPKDDGVKRFKALVARKTDPVPRYQFVQLYRWLVQVTGGLPTTPPSPAPSAGGDGETEAGSQAGSPSTEATSTA